MAGSDTLAWAVAAFLYDVVESSEPAFLIEGRLTHWFDAASQGGQDTVAAWFKAEGASGRAGGDVTLHVLDGPPTRKAIIISWRAARSFPR